MLDEFNIWYVSHALFGKMFKYNSKNEAIQKKKIN